MADPIFESFERLIKATEFDDPPERSWFMSNGRKFLVIEEKPAEWTREPPSEPGWFWVMPARDDEQGPYAWRHSISEGETMVHGTASIWSVKDMEGALWWPLPIAPPPPPEEHADSP